MKILSIGLLLVASTALMAMDGGKVKTKIRLDYTTNEVLPAARRLVKDEKLAQLEAFGKTWQSMDKEGLSEEAQARHKAFRKALKKALRANHLVKNIAPQVEGFKEYAEKWSVIASNAQEDAVAKFIEAAISSRAATPCKETAYKAQDKNLRKAIKHAVRDKANDAEAIAAYTNAANIA